MVDTSRERHLWWFEGVVGREVNREKEDTTLIRRVGRTHDGGLPMEQIFADWTCRALGWWISAQILQLLVDPLQSHFAS